MSDSDSPIQEFISIPPPTKKKKTLKRIKPSTKRLNFVPTNDPETVSQAIVDLKKSPTRIGRTNKFIRWENGVPVPCYGQSLQANNFKDLSLLAFSLPYEGEIDKETGERIIDPEFVGMTNAEVMYVKLGQYAAQGDLDAATFLLDRIIGKPKQQTENLSVKMGYQEFLEALSEQDNPNNPNNKPQNNTTDNIEIVDADVNYQFDQSQYENDEDEY